MKKVDSSENAPYVIASGACTAWQSINTPKADSSMDRHADKSARDDRGGARLASERKTSNATNPNHTKQAARLKTSKATILNKKLGGRICDEKAGLCSGEQGDKTRASIDTASHKLPALSRKANAKRSKL